MSTGLSGAARAIEELTLNAWPPLETLLFDGWILSFSNRYTRRANSVHPLYPSTLPLLDKIATCEAVYAARDYPETVFKITSAPEDAALDRALAARGYARIALTSVQTAALDRLPAAADAGVVISSSLTERWFADFNRLAATPEPLQASERRLLEKIGVPHAFGSVSVDGQSVALGLAVHERGHVGLFDVVVDGRHRKRGLARRLCAALLAWGHAAGADTAYLAVMADNTAALQLYAGLGFHEVYRYWYRFSAVSQ